MVNPSNIGTIVSIDTGVKPEGAKRTVQGVAVMAVLSLAAARFLRWRELRRSRRALERLSETELRDIGLTRNQALTEYRKSLYID